MRISSCIFLFYICVSTAAAAQIAVSPGEDPDRLYTQRTDLASARRAAQMWKDLYARAPGGGFDAAWKLARADYWLGGHAPASERRGFLEDGIDAGRKAVALRPDRPEGHFWIGANMGALAESFGLRQGLKYRKTIKQELETVLRLDPAFQQGSADRALGRWYFKVPGLFGGSHKLAEQHLRASLKYNPHSAASHFFLAEVLLDDGRKEEGRAEMQKALDSPNDPDWVPENQEFKAKARTLLASLKSEVYE